MSPFFTLVLGYSIFDVLLGSAQRSFGINVHNLLGLDILLGSSSVQSNGSFPHIFSGSCTEA